MEGVLITRDREFQAEKAVVNFLTRLLLQAQTSWSCQFFTNLLFLCLKDTKGACSGHFFKPYIIEALVRKKLNFFPSMSCLPSCVCSVMSHSLQPHGLCPWPLCPWIFQARILKWVAMPFSRASSWPRDWTWVSCIAGKFFTFWATHTIPSHLALTKRGALTCFSH